MNNVSKLFIKVSKDPDIYKIDSLQLHKELRHNCKISGYALDSINLKDITVRNDSSWHKHMDNKRIKLG